MLGLVFFFYREEMVILLLLLVLLLSSSSSSSSIHSDGLINNGDIVITPGLIFNPLESVIFVNDEIFYINLNIGDIFKPLDNLIRYLETTIQDINKYPTGFAVYQNKLVDMKYFAMNIQWTLRNEFFSIYMDSSIDIPTDYFETYLNSGIYIPTLLTKVMKNASELAKTLYPLEYEVIHKSLHDVINMYFHTLNGIRTTITNFQTEFLMMLRDKYLSPSLINETELNRFLSTTLNKYHNSVIISYHGNNWKKYYNLCKIIDVRMVSNQYDRVLLTVTIPIRALQTIVFDIYHIIPLYMSTSPGGYGYLVEPRYRYLAVSSNQDWFTFMENLSDCRSVLRFEYSLCRPKLEFIRDSEDDCLIGMFTKNPKTKCLRVAAVDKFNPQFINLGNNRWFYSIQEKNFSIKQICLNHDRHNGSIILSPGIGYFTLEQNCYGQSVDNTFLFKSDIYSFSISYKFEFYSLNSAISSSLSSSSSFPSIKPSSSSFSSPVYWLTISVISLLIGVVILIVIMFVFFVVKRRGKVETKPPRHDSTVIPLQQVHPLLLPPPVTSSSSSSSSSSPPPPSQPLSPPSPPIYPLPNEEYADDIYEDVDNYLYRGGGVEMRDDYVRMNSNHQMASIRFAA